MEQEKIEEEFCEEEYCDDCGRECDGAHASSFRIISDEQQIKNIIKIILSQKKNIVNEVIKRLNEIDTNKQ
jgi:hypothetical protein